MLREDGLLRDDEPENRVSQAVWAAETGLGARSLSPPDADSDISRLLLTPPAAAPAR